MVVSVTVRDLQPPSLSPASAGAGSDVALIFTRHARDRMGHDGIAAAWVEAVIMQPEHTMPDPDDRALTLAWRRIPEFGGRFVRVFIIEAEPIS